MARDAVEAVGGGVAAGEDEAAGVQVALERGEAGPEELGVRLVGERDAADRVDERRVVHGAAGRPVQPEYGAEAVGQPDMLQRPEFESRPARIANYEKVVAFLAPIFKGQPRAYWEERLARLEVPHSPVFSSKEVIEGPLAAHHRIVTECEGPRGMFRTIRSPLHFDGEAERTVTAPPELGQDNAEYLGKD